MPIGSLERVVSSLAKYYNLPEQDRLLDASIALNNETDAPDAYLSKLILRGIDGSLTTKEIINEINQYLEKSTSTDASDQINQFIKIFTTADDQISAQIPEPIKIPQIIGSLGSGNKETKENSTLSAICVKHARLGLSNRDTNALTLFFNSIPTIELSRCVPFLNIGVITPRPPLSQDGKLNSLSSLKFLFGAETIDTGTANEKMANALALKDGSTFSGMELFTMPQTLINANTLDDASLRVAPVIDKFRPFMSIEKLDLKVLPQDGALSFKKGELYIILHDRSRLHEIAELVKPDLFGKTELLIEYGWSHPAKINERNVYGDLLNAMRVKEKYGVYNASYDFDEVGQVKIKLEIAMKGATDFFNSNISEGDESIINSQKAVRELTEEIAALKESLFTGKENIQFIKRIRPLTILDTPTDLASAPDLKLIRKELRKLRLNVKKGNTPKAAKELFDKLQKLYGTDRGASVQRGEFGNLQRSVAEAIRQKLDIISNLIEKRTERKNSFKQKGELLDPFLDLDRDANQLDYLVGKKVSLGKLFLMFIGHPLVSSAKFDDIQFVFYNFNMNSGEMSGKNIAEFKIDTKDFEQKFKRISLKRQTADMPLWEFKEFIINEYLDDYGNQEYGISDQFLWQTDSATGKRVAIKETNGEGKGIQFEKAELIEGIETKGGMRDGIFKLPIIDIYVETMPGTSLLEGEIPNSKDDKTILKVHIFDRQNSSYETQQALLMAARTDSVETLGKNLNKLKDDPNKHKAEFKKHLKEAERLNIIEPFSEEDLDVGEEKVIKIRGGVRELKRFLYETCPYIVYGSQGSPIINIGYKTIYDSDLTTINLMRSSREGNLVASGQEQEGLPLTMFPGEMSVNCFGIPILNFMQQFFVDLGSYTDIDNLYNVAELSHTISPGEFKTNFRLLPADGYGAGRNFISVIGVLLKQLSGKQT